MSETQTFEIKELDLELIAPSTKRMNVASQGGSKTVIIGKPGCFVPGTLVMMFDGTFKKVEDVKCGEQVMGDDSTPRNVLELCHNYDTMYKIKPTKGESYTVNKKHKLVLVSTGYNQIKKGSVVEMSVEDFLNKSKTYQTRMKIFRTGVEFPKKNLAVDPYFLGLWLGDGTSATSEITTADPEIVEYLQKFSDDNDMTFRKKGNSEYTYRLSSTNDGSKKSNIILNFLRDNNLLNNKHIPHDYKTSSRDDRLSLLAGLLDSDGYYDNDGCCYDFIQKNEKLFDDVMFLIRSLGLSAYKKNVVKSCIYKGEKREGDYFRCCISGNIDEIPCIVERKKAEERNAVKNHLVSGFEVEDVGWGEYYGFMIDDNHRFLLSTFDVVRNTGKTTLIASLLYAKKHIFPVGIVMSGTEDSNGYYRKLFPDSFVFNKYDEDKIKDFIKRQKIAKKHIENPWGVLLLDDCTDDPRIFNKPLQHSLYKNGRHWKMWYILSLQYAMDVKPVIRANVDGCFILREPSVKIRRVIWENYAGIIPDFSLFCDIMDKVTDDYTALYIHNATISNDVHDCIFYYKATPIPDDFKFGADTFWDFNKQRYNEEYVEPFLA